MRTALRRMGNSAGIILPKAILSELGSEIGQDFDVAVEAGRVVVAPLRRTPRFGWAEAAQELAKVEDDALAWPEFASEADDELEW